MKWEIFHRTRYLYASPVRDSFNEVRLQPVTNKEQTVESFLLKILPAARLRHYLDFYSNCIHHFELPEPHSTLTVESQALVKTHPTASLPPEATPAPLKDLAMATRTERCFDYLLASRFVDLNPETWRLALDASHGQTDVWQTALAIMRFLYGHLKYEPASTGVHTHMREVLEQRRGVCQDFAHVMIGMCRSIQLPALYVSGYLATETASATHAWVEVFIPGHGWQPLDPTHNRPADEAYVKLAVGRDYADVPPISGHYKGTTERTMEVDVRITPAN